MNLPLDRIAAEARLESGRYLPLVQLFVLVAMHEIEEPIALRDISRKLQELGAPVPHASLYTAVRRLHDRGLISAIRAGAGKRAALWSTQKG